MTGCDEITVHCDDEGCDNLFLSNVTPVSLTPHHQELLNGLKVKLAASETDGQGPEFRPSAHGAPGAHCVMRVM